MDICYHATMMRAKFEWAEAKNLGNQGAPGVSFEEAQYAFFDKQRIIAYDAKHSAKEERWFCIGQVNDRILTVSFTHRNDIIRILGAGYWRKWSNYYEEETDIQG